MKVCLFLVGLCLLAAPLAAMPLRPGEVSLRLSAEPGAPLSGRGWDPEVRLCGAERPPELLVQKSSAHCQAKHLNLLGPITPGQVLQIQPFLRLGVASVEAADDGTFRATLFARALAFSAPRPIETSCGRWTYSLRLDPRATQAVSEVVLQPGVPDASWGTLSGELQMAAQLRFESVGKGPHATAPVIVPITLRLDLAGSWLTVEDGPAGDAAQSNLVLFPGDPVCARLRPLAGRVCLSSDPSVLSLNP